MSCNEESYIEPCPDKTCLRGFRSNLHFVQCKGSPLIHCYCVRILIWFAFYRVYTNYVIYYTNWLLYKDANRKILLREVIKADKYWEPEPKFAAMTLSMNVPRDKLKFGPRADQMLPFLLKLLFIIYATVKHHRR